MNSNIQPLVSISCIAYNHGKYIGDCLEGFLAQKTTFPFEIIVHDDASTDETAAIIEDYREKYPDLIKPVYQQENQYSKGVKITETYIGPKVKGKYVATCEGDDFWTDPYKLQKQVEFLESNPEYIMCFHRVAVVNRNKDFLGRFLGPKARKSREISMIEAVTGGVIHFSSILLRAQYYTAPRPSWTTNAHHGDYAFCMHLAAEGKIFYLHEVMSNYRSGVENSMMAKFRENYTKENDINYHRNRIETLELANEYYEHKFAKEIGSVINISETRIHLLTQGISVDALRAYRKHIRAHGLLSFCKQFLLIRMPRMGGIGQVALNSIRKIRKLNAQES